MVILDYPILQIYVGDRKDFFRFSVESNPYFLIRFLFIFLESEILMIFPVPKCHPHSKILFPADFGTYLCSSSLRRTNP